jgi:hypothetical protein
VTAPKDGRPPDDPLAQEVSFRGSRQSLASCCDAAWHNEPAAEMRKKYRVVLVNAMIRGVATLILTVVLHQRAARAQYIPSQSGLPTGQLAIVQHRKTIRPS